MRLFAFDDPAHRETSVLLPWYVNGTLSGVERARVDQHVRECVACKRDLEAQLRLCELVRADSPYPASSAALARLCNRIDAQPTGPSPAESQAASRRAWWQRHYWLGWAVAAQLALVFVAVALWPHPPATNQFHTLASAPALRLSADAVVVVFDGAATQAQIGPLLRDLDARIVDGPNLRDAYTLELPPGRQAAALAALQRIPWVKFAQPAPGSRGMQP